MMEIHDKRIRGAALVVLVLALGHFLMPSLLQSEAAEKQAVLQSIDECLNTEGRNPCFKALSEEFIEHDKLGTVFALLQDNQQTPKLFESCHVLLHYVGQAAYKKVGDISKTLKHGNYVCFAGFYHGALEGYFIENDLLASNDGGLEALRTRIPEICIEAELEIKKDYHECLHGLGHGLMFAVDGELPQALALCDALGDASKASWCYSGAFMENSTSTTNPDHPSKYLRADDPFYPCSILDEKYLYTCYILQSMHVTNEARGDWAKTSTFCMKVPSRQRNACFNGMGQSLIGFNPDPKLTRDNCLNLPLEFHKECIAGAVGGIGERYKPPFELITNFCSVFDGINHTQCYEAAFASMNNWSKDHWELKEFCESALETSIKNSCLMHLNGR